MDVHAPFRRTAARVVACGLVLLLTGAGTARGENAGASPPPASGLDGRVADEAGRGVPGCEVRVPELLRSTVTGSDGSFQLLGLPHGRYTLTVQRFGYTPAVQAVITPASMPVVLTVTATPFRLPAIEVTGTRAPLAPGSSSLPTAMLHGDALRLNTSVSLAHAIEALPGMRTASTGQQVGKPVIRGLQGARVLVLDAGRRLEDYSWSDEDGPSIDARLVESVEVVRGPASVLYGSGAMGGVVNAIPAPLPEAAGTGGFWRGRLESFAGSNNLELGSALRLEGARGSMGWRAHGVGRVSGDLHTPDGKLANTGFGAFNGDAAWGVHGALGNAGVRVVHYGGEFKLLEKEGPGTGFGGVAEEEGPERKLLDDRVQLGANYFTHGLRLESRGQWQRHSLIEVADDPGAAPGSGQESEQFKLLLNTGTLDLIAHHAQGRWRGSAGVWGLTQVHDTRGPIPLIPDAHATAGAVFAFEQLDVGRFSLLAGARNDWQHLDVDGNDVLHNPDAARNDIQGSGNAGIVFHVTPQFSLAANAGRGWRAPTVFELYSNGPHLGEARYEIGRADLSPETNTGADLHARLQTPRVRAQAGAFWNGVRDFIFVQPTGEIRDGLQVFRHEQADATLAGGEVRIDAEVAPRWTAHAGFDAVRGDNDELDEPLPLIPASRSIVGIEKRWETLEWAQAFTAGADVALYARQTRLSAFDTGTASYALLHLALGLRGRWLGRNMEFNVQVRNATNTRYRDFLSRYKDFALDPGRNVLVHFATDIR